MAHELAQYQFQLEQVDEAIAKDPENQELHKLRESITELITLYSDLAKQQASSSNSESKKKSKFAEAKAGGGSNRKSETSAQSTVRLFPVGATVLAKHPGDGNFYEAVVNILPGDPEEGLYTVTFKEYSITEAVPPTDVRPFSSQKRTSAPVTAATLAATNPDINKKKKKFRPKEGHVSKRDKEQTEKQAAWLSFAGGDSKKRKASGGLSTVKPPLKKSSIFATPDDPMAKVGVIGSGKPMTQFQQRGKHVFIPN
ncbi:hypothetical protein DFS34DRAFT_613289 [Phlyctochytrium arcticum]|nr:hypothetical protein DFS34DRAFT_613289 [Phlyctochytrium arcticum]